MKGSMEKKRKNIFDRLMDFWKERIGMAEADGIGFWTEAKEERIFAEERAVLLPQESRRKFWEQEELTEKENHRGVEPPTEEQEKKTEQARAAKLFFAEDMKEAQSERREKNGMGRAFQTEGVMETQKVRRQIIPITAEKEKMLPATEEQTVLEKREKPEKEEQSEIDIERLMRQMTKRLWEERESCGRRLR